MLDTVHVDLIGSYSKYIRKQHPGGTIIKNNISLTCMVMINPAIGWFEIFKVPTYDLDDITGINNYYIDKSSYRVSQSFNNTFLSRYPHPCKGFFDNRPDFKWYFTPLLKGFNIKPVLTRIKNPQANAPVDRVHQIILNMLVTKDLS